MFLACFQEDFQRSQPTSERPSYHGLQSHYWWLCGQVLQGIVHESALSRRYDCLHNVLKNHQQEWQKYICAARFLPRNFSLDKCSESIALINFQILDYFICLNWTIAPTTNISICMFFLIDKNNFQFAMKLFSYILYITFCVNLAFKFFKAFVDTGQFNNCGPSF